MGKGATALKKINARVKKLAKRYPGKKRSTLQKQAGAEYRAGKLKAKRKPAKRKAVKRARRRGPSKKIGAVKKRAVRRVRRSARKTTRRVHRSAAPKVIVRTRTRTKTVRIGRRRSSGVGSKKGLVTGLLIAGAALVGYMLLKPKANSQIVYVPTGNAARDSQAQNILMYANAANATATAIANILKAINQANATGSALPDSSAVQSIIAQSSSSTSNIAGQRLLG